MAPLRLLTTAACLPLLLGGCAAAMVAGAAGAAAEGASGGRSGNKAFMQAAARQACSAQAAQYGTAQVTAAQQATPLTIVVTGTVADADGTYGFTCQFETSVIDFKLGPLQPRK